MVVSLDRCELKAYTVGRLCLIFCESAFERCTVGSLKVSKFTDLEDVDLSGGGASFVRAADVDCIFDMRSG